MSIVIIIPNIGCTFCIVKTASDTWNNEKDLNEGRRGGKRRSEIKQSVTKCVAVKSCCIQQYFIEFKANSFDIRFVARCQQSLWRGRMSSKGLAVASAKHKSRLPRALLYTGEGLLRSFFEGGFTNCEEAACKNTNCDRKYRRCSHRPNERASVCVRLQLFLMRVHTMLRHTLLSCVVLFVC